MKAISLGIILACGATPVLAAPGAGDVHAGNDAYRKGKFEDALAHYEKARQRSPSDARIEYDLGVAAYRTGDYDRAAAHFQKSLLTDDDTFRRDVYYNQGDALYRSGISREKKDMAGAIKQLRSSLESFEKARALDTGDKEAAENYEFVKKEIERLRKQQEQQKQRQRQKQQQQDQQQGQKDPQQQQEPSQQPQQEQQDQPQGEKQDKEKPQDQGEQQKDAPPKEPPKDQQSAAGQSEARQISSQKDANDMVDDFERNEMPKGFLNLNREPGQPRPVEKDW